MIVSKNSKSEKSVAQEQQESLERKILKYFDDENIGEALFNIRTVNDNLPADWRAAADVPLLKAPVPVHGVRADDRAVEEMKVRMSEQQTEFQKQNTEFQKQLNEQTKEFDRQKLEFEKQMREVKSENDRCKKEQESKYQKAESFAIKRAKLEIETKSRMKANRFFIGL